MKVKDMIEKLQEWDDSMELRFEVSIPNGDDPYYENYDVVKDCEFLNSNNELWVEIKPARIAE